MNNLALEVAPLLLIPHFAKKGILSMSASHQKRTVTTRYTTTTATAVIIVVVAGGLAGCFPHARMAGHPAYPGGHAAQSAQPTQSASASATVVAPAQPAPDQAVASPFEGVVEAPQAEPGATLVEPAPPVVNEAPPVVAASPTVPSAPAAQTSPAVQPPSPAPAPTPAVAPAANGSMSVAIAARPQFHALMQRSQAMMSMGQYHQALRILNAARRFRQHPAILFNMAICLEHIGAFRRAAAIYQRVTSDPTVGARARERVSVLMNAQAGIR